MQIKKGQIIEGKITAITKYGAFVNIDNETSGMVHISEISAGFVKDINEVLQINQTVKAVVLNINENGKLALSIKQAGAGSSRPDEKSEFAKPEKNTTAKTNNFEDMMNKFKRESDEKISDLKFLEPKRNNSSRRRKD